MAHAGGIRAGKAYVEVGADNSKLEKGLRLAQKKLKEFGSAVKHVAVDFAAAGAVISAFLGEALKHFGEVGTELRNMAIRTGFSTDALQELGFAATVSGARLQDIENTIKLLSRSIHDAKNGLGPAVLAFKELGMTVQDLAGMSPEEQYLKVAEALAAIPNPVERSALAMRLFGRWSGRAILPMLADLPRLRAEFIKLGVAISQEDVQAAYESDRAWKVLKASIGGLLNQVGAAFEPMTALILTGVGNIVQGLAQWVKFNLRASESWQGIVDAVGAGDLALAGNIALLGLEVGWLKVTEDIRVAWAEMISGIQSLWLQLMAEVKATAANLSADIKNILATIVQTSKSIGNKLGGAYAKYVYGADVSSGSLAFAQDAYDEQIANDLADQYDQNNSGRMNTADAQAAAADAAAEAARKRVDDARKALDAAQSDLDALREQAKFEKEHTANAESPQLANLPDFFDDVKKKISAAGTFSASAAFGLAGGPFSNLEKKADEQLRVLKDIRDNTEEGAAFE